MREFNDYTSLAYWAYRNLSRNEDAMVLLNGEKYLVRMTGRGIALCKRS